MLSWDESSIYHAERKVTAVRFSKWHIAPEKPEAQACLRAAGYPYLVAAVLSARGIETPEQAAAFLEREDKLTISPFLMRNMDKAAARVQQAIANGERIAVFGDYDVDGITATCILVDYLKSRGADVVHYIPRRIEDGYGLSRDAIKGLFDQGVRLLVTVDCGITGVEEVDYANSLGLDVVITDHHECREVLPRAVAVVDPHRADCGYPFKFYDDSRAAIPKECDPQEVYFYEYNNHECMIAWDGDKEAYDLIVGYWGEEVAKTIERL